MENKIKLLNTSSSTYFANNRLDIGSEVPTSGTYNMGDIIIKSTQVDGEPIGWICIESGNPGVWNEFGGTIKIENPFTLEPGCIGNTELASEIKLKLLELENKDLVNESNINQLESNINNKLTKLQSNVNNQLTQLQTDVENNINPKINTNTAKIGDLNSLSTENKTDLVAAINEVFQCGNNVKQNLVDALIAKKVKCSTSDSFDTLINNIYNMTLSTLPSWASTGQWLTAKSKSYTGRYLDCSVVGDYIYVMGGYNGSARSYNERYNTLDNTWTTMTALPATRYGLSTTSVNELIYAIGGYSNQTTNYCYDPVANSWSTKTAIPTGRFYHSVISVGTNVYVIGGSGPKNTNECYDTLTDTWSTKATMTTARYGMCSSAIGDNIYVIGGYNGSYLSKNECYDTLTDTWTTKTSMTTARYYLPPSVDPLNGKIYVLGGNGSSSYLTVNEVYDPINDSWETKAPMTVGKYGLCAAAVNGNIYNIAGYTGSYVATNYCLLPE